MFNSFGSFLRSLTLSPAASALDQAHRMAQRRLADGGATASARSATNKNTDPADLVLPADADALAVAKAIRQKLGMKEGDDPLHPLERMKLGGRVVLRRRHLLRIGDGRFDRGKRFLYRVVSDIRQPHRSR